MLLEPWCCQKTRQNTAHRSVFSFANLSVSHVTSQVHRNRAVMQISSESSSALKKPEVVVKEPEQEPESTTSHSTSAAAPK
jgi:hypothetical protein